MVPTVYFDLSLIAGLPLIFQRKGQVRRGSCGSLQGKRREHGGSRSRSTHRRGVRSHRTAARDQPQGKPQRQPQRSPPSSSSPPQQRAQQRQQGQQGQLQRDHREHRAPQ